MMLNNIDTNMMFLMAMLSLIIAVYYGYRVVYSIIKRRKKKTGKESGK